VKKRERGEESAQTKVKKGDMRRAANKTGCGFMGAEPCVF